MTKNSRKKQTKYSFRSVSIGISATLYFVEYLAIMFNLHGTAAFLFKIAGYIKIGKLIYMQSK